MAKRSDFAQKLLDDLRIRKERMASASQSSSQSQFHTDAYAYSKQTGTGSRNTKANEIVTSRNGDMMNRSSRSYRSSNSLDVSNQIVSYGKGQNSLKMSDVSLALAFAFENGGRPRRADSPYNISNSSAISFLHQIKRGTIELSMMERQGSLARQQGSNNNHFQALSPLQINEISKGAQKLNQILRACSNGFNIDRYSLEIAKELFQGAIDLEQSLRMLVDLQQNSEFMIAPQKKNRITLLDEDTDDDDDHDNKMIRASEQNQLAPPVFSFDKQSRHSLMQRQIVLGNSKEGRNLNNRKQDGKMLKASPQKKQTRSSSEFKNLNAVSEQKNHSALAKSNTEKGRIPSVIAKLMGLDSLPEEKAEMKNMSQKDSGNTQRIRGNHGMAFQHTAKESTKRAEPNRKETESLVTKKQQKLIEAFNRPETQDKEFGADKNSSIQKAGSKEFVQNGKPLWHDLYGIRTLKDFDKANTKIDKHHNIGENQTDVWGKGRKHDPAHSDTTQQKITVKGRINDPTINNVLSQLEQVKVKSSLQEEKEINVSNVQFAKRDNQKKSQNHVGIQKSNMMPKNGPQEEKHHREQRREKQMLQMKSQGGSELNSKSSLKNQHQFNISQKKQIPVKQNFAENVKSMKLEGFLSTHHDDLVKQEASNDIDRKVKGISSRKLGDIIAMVDEKNVHKLANVKAKNTRKQKVDVPGKIDEKLIERNRRKLVAAQVEQKINILQGSRQGKTERFNVLKEADACIINTNESVNVAQQRSVALAPNDLDHAAPVVAEEGFQTGKIALDKINGTHEKNHVISKKRIEEPLTESENRLKRILVTSQLFLNTAEALFRLNIPFSILQDGDQDDEGECNKLILDCAYEVMKRKGIVTELKLNPCSNISISAINITTLDDLVRKLNKDMDKLKFYGRSKSSLANNVEDYLPKMLEHDVYNTEPDIDSMWDFGWNDKTFAFVEKCDVVKDMEKHVLNVLLDEITRDLWIFHGGLKLTTIH